MGKEKREETALNLQINLGSKPVGLDAGLKENVREGGVILREVGVVAQFIESLPRTQEALVLIPS